MWRLGVTNGGVGVRRGTELNSRGRKKRGPPPQHRTGLAVTEGGRSPGALIELLSKFTDPLMDPHIQNHLSLYLLAQSGCMCVSVKGESAHVHLCGYVGECSSTYQCVFVCVRLCV